MKLDTVSDDRLGRLVPALIVSAFFFLFLLYAFAPASALFKLAWQVPLTDSEHWYFIKHSMLATLLLNSALLCVGVVILSVSLGVSLTVALEFVPPRYQALAEVLLTLPMSLPIYLYSFIYVGIFEWSSPWSQFLRWLTAGAIQAIPLKNMLGAIVVFSLALYPYILLPVRLSLRGRSASLLKSGRLVGRPTVLLWWDLLRALGARALLVGSVIIAMECLSEFGAVSMLGIDTFTTAIYTAWSSFYSLEIAARLGVILLFAIVPLNLGEQLLKNSSAQQVERHGHGEEFSYRTRGRALALTWIAVMVFFALVLPLAQLVLWLMAPVYHQVMSFDGALMLRLSGMTIGLGLTCALVVMALNLALTVVLRFYRHLLYFDRAKSWLNLSLYGYAVPGNLLAIAFLGVGQVVIGSYSFASAVLLLVAALALKFFRTGFKKCEVGDEAIDHSLEQVGKLYHEGRPFKFLRVVYTPLLKPYLFYGFLFVAIEVMKELPLTMILRPMGLNTLSTKLFELTSEGEWVSAAPYAMVLMVLCCLFHFKVARAMGGSAS